MGTKEKLDTKNVVSLQHEMVGTTLCYGSSVTEVLGSWSEVWGGLHGGHMTLIPGRL